MTELFLLPYPSSNVSLPVPLGWVFANTFPSDHSSLRLCWVEEKDAENCMVFCACPPTVSWNILVRVHSGLLHSPQSFWLMPTGNSLRVSINSLWVCGPQLFQADMLVFICCLVFIRILTDFCNIILHILHSIKSSTLLRALIVSIKSETGFCKNVPTALEYGNPLICHQPRGLLWTPAPFTPERRWKH